MDDPALQKWIKLSEDNLRYNLGLIAAYFENEATKQATTHEEMQWLEESSQHLAEIRIRDMQEQLAAIDEKPKRKHSDYIYPEWTFHGAVERFNYAKRELWRLTVVAYFDNVETALIDMINGVTHVIRWLVDRLNSSGEKRKR